MFAFFISTRFDQMTTHASWPPVVKFDLMSGRSFLTLCTFTCVVLVCLYMCTCSQAQSSFSIFLITCTCAVAAHPSCNSTDSKRSKCRRRGRAKRKFCSFFVVVVAESVERRDGKIYQAGMRADGWTWWEEVWEMLPCE